MKVNNKGGKGNPYHKESNGRFTSADGVGSAAVEETEETKMGGSDETAPAKKLPSFLKPKKELHKMLKPKGSVVSGGLEDALKRGLKNAENEEKRSKIVTLRDFKKTHDKNLSWLISHHTLVDFDEESVKIINDKIDELKKTSRLCVNARISVVPLILKNGQKNQFETKTTRGYYGPERLVYSQKRFGTPKSFTYGDKECYQLEKYGNIQSPDLYTAITNRDCSMYGTIKLYYKRENVDYRTTLSLGDSLNNRMGMQPGLFTDKSDIAMWGRKKSRDYTKYDEKKIVSRISQAKSLHEISDILGFEYAETQIHGEITPNDFESMSIDKISDFEAGYCDEAIIAAQQLGMPTYCASDGNIYQVSIEETADGSKKRKKVLVNAQKTY